MNDVTKKFNTESEDADQTQRQDYAANYFGDCPICHKNNGYLNVGRDHWFVCSTHACRWYIGTNLFSSAIDETPEQQREEQERLGFDFFAEVEPFYSPARGTTRNAETTE